MKAYELQAIGNLDGLRLVDRPEPNPAHGQIVVRVRAASLNYRDLIVMQGAYGRVSLPLAPLSDGAGEIVAVGEGVTRWQPGDRVAGTFFPDWLAGPVTAESTKAALGGGSRPPAFGRMREHRVPGTARAGVCPARPWGGRGVRRRRAGRRSDPGRP